MKTVLYLDLEDKGGMINCCGDLTFMGPCIVIIFYYISKKMQRYTAYFIWKLFYMFRVVSSLISVL
jgi:hypothetical protein